jgi:hypothetical protein
MCRHHTFGNNTSRSHCDGRRNMFVAIIVVTTAGNKDITCATLFCLVSKTLTLDIRTGEERSLRKEFRQLLQIFL